MSTLCTARPTSIFTLYPNDERSYQTIGTRYDMEKGVRLFRLGIFPDCLDAKKEYE